MNDVVNINGQGHNAEAELAEKRKEVSEIIGSMVAVKKQRTALNAQMQELREKLPPLGVPKEAADMAIRYMNWDEDRRRGFDAAYQLAREAIGLPVQADLEELLNKQAEAE